LPPRPSETRPFIPSAAHDIDVLARAAKESRILVTFDRDFGALAFRSEVPAPAAVILFRFSPVSPDEPAAILADLIEREDIELEGRFTVVDRDRIRQRPLPHREDGV